MTKLSYLSKGAAMQGVMETIPTNGTPRNRKERRSLAKIKRIKAKNDKPK